MAMPIRPMFLRWYMALNSELRKPGQSIARCAKLTVSGSAPLKNSDLQVISRAPRVSRGNFLRSLQTETDLVDQRYATDSAS